MACHVNISGSWYRYGTKQMCLRSIGQAFVEYFHQRMP